MIDPVLILPISLSFAVFWALSAYHKVSENAWFKDVLKDYNIFPAISIKPLSILVPTAELIISIVLIVVPVWGACASIILLFAYGLLLLFNHLRGHILKDCGCAWGRHEDANNQTGSVRLYVIRNLVLAFLSAMILLPMRPRALMWMDWMNAVMASIVILGFVFTVLRLFSNYSRMKGFGHV